MKFIVKVNLSSTFPVYENKKLEKVYFHNC